MLSALDDMQRVGEISLANAFAHVQSALLAGGNRLEGATEVWTGLLDTLNYLNPTLREHEKSEQVLNAVLNLFASIDLPNRSRVLGVSIGRACKVLTAVLESGQCCVCADCLRRRHGEGKLNRMMLGTCATLIAAIVFDRCLHTVLAPPSPAAQDASEESKEKDAALVVLVNLLQGRGVEGRSRYTLAHVLPGVARALALRVFEGGSANGDSSIGSGEATKDGEEDGAAAAAAGPSAGQRIASALASGTL